MKFKQRVKKTGKMFVDAPSWTNLNQHKHVVSDLAQTVKKLFTAKELSEDEKETFEEACARLGLTEQILKKRAIEFGRLSLLFGLATLGVFSYFVYLMIAGHFLAMMVTFAITAFCLSQFFRYHFWRFQIKNRKLGCSFQEWLNQGLLGRRK